jgi:hypothetical protein
MKNPSSYFIPLSVAVVSVAIITAFTIRMSPEEGLKGKYAYKDFESERKYSSAILQAGYIIRRNIRIVTEFTQNKEPDSLRKARAESILVV